MLYTNNTEKLIGLQELNTKNVEEIDGKTVIFAEIYRKEQVCPCCGTKTNKVHDYRVQDIKDIPAFGKHTIIRLRKRRYVCPSCKKRFYEVNDWLPRYHRMTNRIGAYIIDKLREVRTFTSVGREVNLSVTTVIRVFNIVNYSPQSLPEVIGIDEFKGNTGKEKYQCIVTDIKTGKVVDILPTRYKSDLFRYFKAFDRSSTTHFVSDMWETYEDVSKTYFKNATYVIDKYHYYRQVFWAFEAIRKQEQKKFCKENRLLFKHSKRLLTKRYKLLTVEEKQTVDYILYISDPLLHAHSLKEAFYDVIDCEDRNSAEKALANWILYAQDSEIQRFTECSNTFINWSEGILNSFTCPYTNGFTEGCNNKIKVLKRTAYGYRNFKRFRNRILHVFSNQNIRKQTQKFSAV